MIFVSEVPSGKKWNIVSIQACAQIQHISSCINILLWRNPQLRSEGQTVFQLYHPTYGKISHDDSQKTERASTITEQKA
jgi:hypothetical protein